MPHIYDAIIMQCSPMVATKTELHGYLHLSTSININRDNYVEDRVLQYVDTVNLRSQHTNHEDTLTNVRPMRSAITHVLCIGWRSGEQTPKGTGSQTEPKVKGLVREQAL